MPSATKRAAIMQAAEHLFTSRRLHEITLDEVAETAGVGKGTIYRYFQDKDDLFFQTATAGFDDLCQLLRRKAPQSLTFDRQLLAACKHIAAFHEQRRQLFGMMQAEENRMHWFRGDLRRRWQERRRALVAALAEIVRRGVAAGEVRRDVAPEVLAGFLLGMLRTQARDLPETLAAPAPHRLVTELFRNGARTNARDRKRSEGRS